LKNKILQTLTRKGEFRNVFEQGHKFPSKYLVLYVHPNGLECCRVGFAISRKVGNAVTRNRVRRRLREIFRNLLKDESLCFDIVAVARSAARDADFSDLERNVFRVFAGLKHENIIHRDHQAL
jgi:ribonuclease P protein component